MTLVSFAIAIVAGYLAARIILTLARAVARRTESSWDDELLDRLRAPLQISSVLGAVRLVPEISPTAIDNAVLHAWPVVLIWLVFWIFNRVVMACERTLIQLARIQRSPIARAFVPILLRSTRTIVWIVCALTILAQLGYSVAGILAGLGIGGIALALAAQKTIEHLFGAIAIGVDDLVREGERIKVKGIEGIVEAIGLRTTRLRTVDNTLVTIPNGQLADSWIELQPRS